MLEIQVGAKLAKLEERVLKVRRRNRIAAIKKQKKAQKKLPKRKKKPASEKAKRRSRKPIKFVNTKLGRFLLVNAPLEYQIICDAIDPDRMSVRNTGQVIKAVETIAYASDNPVFRSPDFRVALVDFRLFGLRTRTKTNWSLKQVVIAAQNQRETIKLQDV